MVFIIVRINRYGTEDVRVLSSTKLDLKTVPNKDSKSTDNDDNAILRIMVDWTVVRGCRDSYASLFQVSKIWELAFNDTPISGRTITES